MNRNVVLVTIDSLRADHCGFLGYGKDTTPTLDSMADEGVVFENAIAPGPKTPESMPAIFTGFYPPGGSGDAEFNSWKDCIRPHVQAHDTIPEQFSRQGYETVGFTPNGFTSQVFGFDKGFDHFQDFLGEDIRPGMDVPNVFRGLFKWIRHEGNWKRWDKYYNEIIESIDAISKPYFLWVFLMDVHAPYLTPASYRTDNSWFDMVYSIWQDKRGNSDAARSRLISAYDDTIRYADEFIRRLSRDLSDSNPVFVVHADHGEAFGDHGLYGHELQLYQENVHVPLIIWNANECRRVSEPFSLRQLNEILNQISRKNLSKFSSWLRSEVTSSPVIAQSKGGDWKSVRSERYNMVINNDGAELYDISQDPGEKNNLTDNFPKLAHELKKIAYNHTICQKEIQSIWKTCKTHLPEV